jgi:hypothetical protein
MFLAFKDLQDVKRTNIFATSFFGNRRPGEEQVNGECHEDQKRTYHAAWGPSSASWVPMLETLAPPTRLDLKPTIYSPLLAILRWGGGET